MEQGVPTPPEAFRHHLRILGSRNPPEIQEVSRFLTTASIVLMSSVNTSPGSEAHALMNLHNPLRRWRSALKLDACVPNTRAIKGIGYDIYESYGSRGSTRWRDFDGYFAKIKAFHGPRGLAWGLSETGLTERAIAARPTWFTDVIRKLKANGGTWFDYFNTTNWNSPSDWYMQPGSRREKAFIRELVAN